MSSAIERAISCIWERYDEPLSLSDIAQSAILSRFHFSRVFRDETGVPPGRFLSAVRIYQAKRMLATTSMKVTDISFAVGFNSLGSFTNHFTDSVGVSPSRFRALCRDDEFRVPEPARPDVRGTGAITGSVELPQEYSVARVYLGAFSTPIVQGQPSSSLTAEIRGPEKEYSYRLAGIPEGECYLHAVAMADTDDPAPWTSRNLLVGGFGQVHVGADAEARADIRLRCRRRTDLPILLALPELERDFARSPQWQPAELARSVAGSFLASA
jgi:AraC family transcriptional regulator